jgi:hypothetical protein
MGEVVSQAMICALKKAAEEIAQGPEVEKDVASMSIDDLKRNYACPLLIPGRR